MPENSCRITKRASELRILNNFLLFLFIKLNLFKKQNKSVGVLIGDR